jgi:hypothetical protein
MTAIRCTGIVFKWSAVLTYSERKVIIIIICTVRFVLAGQTAAGRIEQEWLNGHYPNRNALAVFVTSETLLSLRRLLLTPIPETK